VKKYWHLQSRGNDLRFDALAHPVMFGLCFAFTKRAEIEWSVAWV